MINLESEITIPLNEENEVKITFPILIGHLTQIMKKSQMNLN